MIKHTTISLTAFIIDLIEVLLMHSSSLLILKQAKQIKGDSFVHPQSVYKTYEELFDGEI
jgi:hypothetical protein